jgi:hypothetical protein
MTALPAFCKCSPVISYLPHVDLFAVLFTMDVYSRSRSGHFSTLLEQLPYKFVTWLLSRIIAIIDKQDEAVDDMTTFIVREGNKLIRCDSRPEVPENWCMNRTVHFAAHGTLDSTTRRLGKLPTTIYMPHHITRHRRLRNGLVISSVPFNFQSWLWALKVQSLHPVDSSLELQENRGMISSLHFSLDGSWIVFGSSDKKIRVWEVASGTQVFGPRSYAEGVYLVESPSSGARIISDSNSGDMPWHVTSRCRPELLAHRLEAKR